MDTATGSNNSNSPFPPDRSQQPSNSHLLSSHTPSTCLFCPHPSQDIDTNLLHMSKSHNFFIPDPDYLIDISSFLAFLNTVVSEFNECLFCGTTRSNRWATQDHMKSKGHCRIDLEDEEQEWAEFWEFPEDENDAEEESVKRVKSENELRVGGKTLGHRSKAHLFRRNASRTLLLPPAPTSVLHSSRTSNITKPSTSTELAIRAGASTSLIGVPEQQQRALRVAEKKTLQMEMRAKRRFQDGVEKRGNLQKFFKSDVPGPRNG